MLYHEYTLYAVPTVIVASLAAWLYMKRKGKADKTSIRPHLYGTCASIAIALLVPVVARLFYGRAGLSVEVSLAAAFLVLSLAAVGALYLAFIVRNRKADGTNGTGEAEAAGSLEDAMAESAAALTDTQVQEVALEEESKNVDTVQNIDKIGDEKYPELQENVDDLLNAAMDFKMGGKFAEAISCYRRALKHIQDRDLLTWVIVDLCSLSKIAGDVSVLHEVLESEQWETLDYEIKDEILRNI